LKRKKKGEMREASTGLVRAEITAGSATPIGEWGAGNNAVLPNPEVPEKAVRRTFTAEYKRKVLQEADRCAEAGEEVGALLRREGLYSSHLTTWRRQRAAGELAGLTPRKRGRQGKVRDKEKEQLRLEVDRLKRKLQQAEIVIAIQKKASEILGIPLRSPEDEGND
jgi:transposase-like protein